MKVTNILAALSGAIVVVASPVANGPCVVPAIAFTGVPQPITVQLRAANELTADRRIVTVEKRDDGSYAPMVGPFGEPARFKFDKGALYLLDRGATYVAVGQPMIMIYPPPLASLRFVEAGKAGTDSPLQFYGSYQCDPEGNQQIVVLPQGGTTWAVPRTKSLRQELQYKINGYEGNAISAQAVVIKL